MEGVWLTGLDERTGFPELQTYLGLGKGLGGLGPLAACCGLEYGSYRG